MRPPGPSPPTPLPKGERSAFLWVASLGLRRGDARLVGVAWNQVGQPAYDGVGLDPFRLGVEIGNDAMAQDRRSDLAHVLARHVVAAVQHGTGLRGENQ